MHWPTSNQHQTRYTYTS